MKYINATFFLLFSIVMMITSSCREEISHRKMKNILSGVEEGYLYANDKEVELTNKELSSLKGILTSSSEDKRPPKWAIMGRFRLIDNPSDFLSITFGEDARTTESYFRVDFIENGEVKGHVYLVSSGSPFISQYKALILERFSTNKGTERSPPH